MSNQRTAFEENFDPSQFNLNQYLLKNQNLPQTSPGFTDMDQQFSSQQNFMNGRYTPALGPDTLRNQTMPQYSQSDMKMQPQQQNMLAQLQGMQQQLKQNENPMAKFQVKDSNIGFDNSSQFNSHPVFQANQFDQQNITQSTFNQFNMQPQQQSQQLYQELLKTQSTPQTNNMMMPNQMLPPQMYGQGFMNAAQILANIQQFQQQPPMSHQSSQQSLQDTKVQQTVGGNVSTNMMSMQPLLNINSNLNQYQALIDQIEKQGYPNQQTQMQQPLQQFNQYQPRNSATPSQQLSFQQFPGQSNFQNLQSISGLQNDIQRQPLQQSLQKQNYHDMDPNQSIVSYLQPTTQEQENHHKLESFGGYDQRAKEQAYNPNQYMAKDNHKQSYNNYIDSEKHRVLSDDGNYEGYIQRSPPKNSNKGRENYSPQSNRMNQVNESMSYLNINQQPVTSKLSTSNSPMRTSGRFVDGNANFLENSFRNHNQHHNQSHGSGTILQEQHLNTFQNRNYNQYSPGSQYKFDDGENNYMNQSMNQHKSQRTVNIDEIPVGGKVKTFEELLEAELREKGGEVISNDEYSRREDDGQKKQFLKRKTQKSNINVPTKKYNYYVDNFEEGQKPKKSHDEPAPVKREQPRMTHNSDSNQSLSQPPNSRSYNVQQEQTERHSEQQQTEPNKKGKKTFLARGSGKAGGKQGHSTSRVPPKPEKQQQQQQQQPGNPQRQGTRKTNTMLSDDEYPNDFNFAAEQDTKSPKPQNIVKQNQQKKQPEQHIARNSISEFEKIEQECNTKYSPKNIEQINQSKQTFANKKKKKLFDDSDSNDEQEDEYPVEQITQQPKESTFNQQNETKAPQQTTEDAPKSSVVKKFFYKEDPSKQKQATSAQPPKQEQASTAQMSEQMEKILKQKMEQLDKAIESYNTEIDRAQKMKKDYEQLVNKQRVEYREFETRKKKEMEEIEKLKGEEIDKLKKEKKTLEQRSKNLQLVNSSNKKEREEIDFLKKELQKALDDSKSKDQKNKATIDRLNKQIEELKQRNKEITEELKHMEQIRLQGAQQPKKEQVTNAQPVTMQVNSQQQRYTFSQQEQSKLQQPKGILKNKNEPTSSSKMYSQNDQDQDFQHDDEEEEKDYVDEADDPTYEQEQSAKKSEDSNIQQQFMQFQKQQQQQQMLQQQQQQLQQQNQLIAQQQQQQLQQQQQQQLQQQQLKNQQVAQQQKEQQKPKEEVPPEEADGEEEDFDMKFPPQYHNKTPANMKVIEQIIGHDGKIQRVYENGKKEVIFNNGVKREVFPDGYTIVYFNNNDIKQTYPDQKVIYYFAEAKTTQSTFADGLQVFKFANNQIEKHFPDGTKEIIFPDGTIKCIFADGEEESIFPDGTIQRIEKNGVKAIEFANGQKDILFPDGTRIREYPDGRVRKTFPDGTYENSYRQ